MLYRFLFSALSLLVSVSTSTKVQAKGVVNVYTYRQPDLIQPVFDTFTKETGVLVRTLFLDKGLEERILSEGDSSPVDVIMTVDISRLTRAKEKNITQPLSDETLNANIPLEYRDPEGHWFGLTRRARVLYASKKNVSQKNISYAELADPKWKGKICVRSGQHDYNIALFSAAIAHWGASQTEKWMQGLKKNLARRPQGGDRLQAKAVAIQECDLALGNTYYIALMDNSPKDEKEKKLVSEIKVIFPTFEDGTTHVNISGVALARHAPNRKNAVELIRFLSDHKAQEIYAEKNFEYPVAKDLGPSSAIKKFGTLKADSLPLTEIAKYRRQASEMVDRVGFDDGAQ